MDVILEYPATPDETRAIMLAFAAVGHRRRPEGGAAAGRREPGLAVVISTPLHELLVSLDVPRDGAARAMQALVVRIARAWRQGPGGHIEVGPRGTSRRATGGVLLTRTSRRRPTTGSCALRRERWMRSGSFSGTRTAATGARSTSTFPRASPQARNAPRMSPASASSAASAAAAEPAESISRISWLAMITPSARDPIAAACSGVRTPKPTASGAGICRRARARKSLSVRVDGDLAAGDAGDRHAVDEALGPPADRREPVVARRRAASGTSATPARSACPRISSLSSTAGRE